ncbi:MAG TPA: two-component regulator propeller domain-containing protein [Pyrinomonadaceae bacterium]|nr:two-component regulator propeller domain-containing protein [Pyrinomonadaceae bacterium]
MKRKRPTAQLNIVSGMVLTCVMLAWCSSVWALDPALDVSQYTHEAWRTDDGFTNSEITSIAQTPDGYLWLGTELGLYRFDGLKNVRWHLPADQELPSNWIMSLLAARDGTLWIGTSKGLASWKNGKLIHYSQLAGLYIFKILEDREGAVWTSGVSVTAGKICEIRKGSVKCSGDDGTLSRGAFGLYEDSKGNLWAGVKDGLWRWKPGPPKFYSLAGELNGIQGLSEDGDGTLLVGWNGAVNRFVEGKTQTYPLQGPMPQFQTRSMIRDRQGGMWIGTIDRGLVHIHNGRVDTFTVSDGLSGQFVNSVFEDREGNIWVVTTNGLDRFHDSAVTTYHINQGLASNVVNSVLAAGDGTVWLATHSGLNQWANSQFKTVSVTVGKSNRFVPDSLFEDRSGRIWISTPFQVGYLDNNHFVSLIDVPGAVTSMAQDPAGNLWIANEHAGGLFQVFRERLVQQISWSSLGHTDHASVLAADSLHGGLWIGFFLGGIAYFKDGRIQASYGAQEGLAPGRVSDFLQDGDGTLWIGTEGGLSRLKGGRLVTLTGKNGLPCDAVHWLKEDRAQAFWLYTPCGLVRIARAELEVLATAVDQNIRTDRTLAATIFKGSDGVKSMASGNHFNPQVAKSTNGRLWFVALGGGGVSTIDPAQIPINNLPPPVKIEQLVVDHKVYDATSDARLALPPLIRDLQIEYTALSLVTPEKTLFRYMLEGRDDVWQDAGNRRQAFYTDLPPGNYRFRVMACNNSGVWNEAGTFIDFSIAPAYYQTTWFRVLFVAGLLLLLAALYQLRLRQVAAQVRARLEERVEERERIARDLHDTLLQSVQGLILSVDAAAQQIPPDQPAHRDLEKTLDRAEVVVAEARDRVRNLRTSAVPFGGLAEAFQEVVEEISNGRDPTFKTVVEGNMRELHPVIQEEAYCVGREALINALTHSEAHHVEVEIAYDPRQFRLRVRDDGRGFDPGILKEGGRPNHWGLPGMHERAERIGADLKIWSGHQSGTEVELSVPGATAYQTDRLKAKSSWIRRLLGRNRAM